MLVTAGGLFHYFEEEKVIALLRMLQSFGNMEVVFDSVNKSGMDMLRKKYMKQMGHADVRMFFYVDSAAELARKIGSGTGRAVVYGVSAHSAWRDIHNRRNHIACTALLDRLDTAAVCLRRRRYDGTGASHHHFSCGQSLGGVVAQVIAFRHPEVVKGLVLSNTCSLAKDMDDEAYSHLKKMTESQKKSKKLLSVLPFSLFKRLMKWTVIKKKTYGFTPQEKAVMEELCYAILELLTKPYVYHMIDFSAMRKIISV